MSADAAGKSACATLDRPRCPRRRDGPRDILVGVGRAHECRLELRRRQVHAAVQHPAEESSKPRRIALLGRFPIRHRPVGEEEREHRAHAIHRDTGGGRRFELRPLRFQPAVHLRMRLQVPQHRQSRCYRQRIPRQRSRLVNRSRRRHHAHDVAPPAVCAHRQSTADHLAQRRQIRPYAVPRLRPAERHPKLADNVYRDVGLKYKKARKWAKAVDCLKQVLRSEASDMELRFELSVCNVKQSAKDLTPHLRAEDQALRGFQALLQDKGFKLFDRLKKEKALEAVDLSYVGFHFSEGTGEEQKFGRKILEYVAKRWPKTKEGKAAKNKLKLAPRSQSITPTPVPHRSEER